MTSQQHSVKEQSSPSNPAQAAQADSNNTTLQLRNPFPTSAHNPDPDAIFHHEPEKWHFSGPRKASVPATDVGEKARHTSIDDQELFEEVMRETKGMSAEQVKEYLSTRPRIDGAKIMRGRKGEGYLGLTGAFSGTM